MTRTIVGISFDSSEQESIPFVLMTLLGKHELLVVHAPEPSNELLLTLEMAYQDGHDYMLCSDKSEAPSNTLWLS